MKWYRVYLYSESGSFQGRDEYEAEDDRAAMAIAEMLCDACSDMCETFEVWDGVRRVDPSFSKLPCPSVSAEQVGAMAQASLLRREEAMRDSHWAVARSKRLIERMEHLLTSRRH
jgi:hypothetical protein